VVWFAGLHPMPFWARYPCFLQIVANFGTDLAARPFKGDLGWIRAEASQRLHSVVLATPLPRAHKVGGWGRVGAVSERVCVVGACLRQDNGCGRHARAAMALVQFRLRRRSGSL
jgi:hypothetical protein